MRFPSNTFLRQLLTVLVVMFSRLAMGKLIIRDKYFGKMALDWTWEMERRWYEKVCGRLTCYCGEEEEESGSGRGAHICSWRGPCNDIAEAAVFADPDRDILGLQKRAGKGKGHQI